MDGKIQLTFFLFRLLKEFQMQETIELLPTNDNQQRQHDGDGEGHDQHSHSLELLQTIINYCVNVKMDHIIKIMLEHHNTDTRNNLTLPA